LFEKGLFLGQVKKEKGTVGWKRWGLTGLGEFLLAALLTNCWERKKGERLHEMERPDKGVKVGVLWGYIAQVHWNRGSWRVQQRLCVLKEKEK